MANKIKNKSTKSHGKKFREKAALVEDRKYSIEEACELLTNISTTKFDATAEAHIRINADTTQADQLVRTTVVLPHGTGKSVRIAAFVTDEMVEKAKKAGATIAGKENLISKIEEGNINFDIAVAMPEVMKDLGKIAKVLGQRGLMPNPKAGTVTKEIEKTIEELQKGRVECRMDTAGIIHVCFGKISFGGKKLKENLDTLLLAINEAKPVGIKGLYIASISISPTMGPGIRINEAVKEEK